jgi:hypothetical protein
MGPSTQPGKPRSRSARSHPDIGSRLLPQMPCEYAFPGIRVNAQPILRSDAWETTLPVWIMSISVSLLGESKTGQVSPKSGRSQVQSRLGPALNLRTSRPIQDIRFSDSPFPIRAKSVLCLRLPDPKSMNTPLSFRASGTECLPMCGFLSWPKMDFASPLRAGL